MSANAVRLVVDNAEEAKPEPPRPLMRELPPADPFPIDALGPVLSPAARGIHDRVQVPEAISAQSLLAAATLVVQAFANVELPTGTAKPLSNYFMSVAASGERKTSADTEALQAVRRRESILRDRFVSEHFDYVNAELAWSKAREAAIKKAKGDRVAIKASLDALGAAPLAPLEPMILCSEPTYEGLCKLLATGWPSLGVFSSEGGQFIGGHALNQEAKLRTAAGLSRVWDGDPIDRVRSGDGCSVLPGRRVALHVMLQPEIAADFFNDRMLRDQGLLSRFLLTAPEAASGSRAWREPNAESAAAIARYTARLEEALRQPLPLAPGTQNRLAPRTLPLSDAARALWIRFYDHIERQLRAGGELEPVRGLGNKIPEHAARLAAVLTLIGDLDAAQIAEPELEAGIQLAEHYAAEALRLFGASKVTGELREAQRLLEWLRKSWSEPVISLVDIYQRGPNSIRDSQRARKAVRVLEDHGWLVPIPGGAIVAATFRKDAWRIVRTF